jgi:hypothetical protein
MPTNDDELDDSPKIVGGINFLTALEYAIQLCRREARRQTEGACTDAAEVAVCLDEMIAGAKGIPQKTVAHIGMKQMLEESTGFTLFVHVDGTPVRGGLLGRGLSDLAATLTEAQIRDTMTAVSRELPSPAGVETWAAALQAATTKRLADRGPS